MKKTIYLFLKVTDPDSGGQLISDPPDTDVNKSNKQKKFEKKIIFVGILSATDVKSRIRKSVIRIRIRTKISRIYITFFGEFIGLPYVTRKS